MSTWATACKRSGWSTANEVNDCCSSEPSPQGNHDSSTELRKIWLHSGWFIVDPMRTWRFKSASRSKSREQAKRATATQGSEEAGKHVAALCYCHVDSENKTQVAPHTAAYDTHQNLCLLWYICTLHCKFSSLLSSPSLNTVDFICFLIFLELVLCSALKYKRPTHVKTYLCLQCNDNPADICGGHKIQIYTLCSWRVDVAHISSCAHIHMSTRGPTGRVWNMWARVVCTEQHVCLFGSIDRTQESIRLLKLMRGRPCYSDIPGSVLAGDFGWMSCFLSLSTVILRRQKSQI